MLSDSSHCALPLQKLNQKVSKDIFRSIAQYGTAEGHAGRVMDLMDAVSAAEYSSDAAPNSKQSASVPPSWRSQFFLGPPLSGAPLHSHAPAFNFLIHGRKLWTILPPGLT